MLATFLNRCRQMKELQDDGVWWRFLDPNVSWNEVLHSHPIAGIPRNHLKAPPLDPANPTQAHSYLPAPATSAKLRSSSLTSPSGTPTSPGAQATASAASHTTPRIQYARFPPAGQDLGESELDPYFSSFENSSKELEVLLTGTMEKVNQRLLRHMYSLGEDLSDLGARFNVFSLSEADQSVAHAIEKVGQACDFTYIQSRELSSHLSAGFAEPMRESAQFAGVVRSVLKYRVLKRVQEEMTRDELGKKRATLEQLRSSEAEARRIEQYMASSGVSVGATAPGRPSTGARPAPPRDDDHASVDSDFPPHSGQPVPTAHQGHPSDPPDPDSYPIPTSPPARTSRHPLSTGVANKLLGRLTHAIQGVTDQDPERARRDALGKTRESLSQLELALAVSRKDVRDASRGVLRDLRRFQGQKEEDLRSYMVRFPAGFLLFRVV